MRRHSSLGNARHEQHEQEAQARFRREQPAECTAQERDAIRRFAHDVPGLWHAPETPPQDRQEIVRMLLQRVTVEVQGDSVEPLDFIGVQKITVA